jgi:hypothetical protein
LLNEDVFDVLGITVNAIYNGGEIDEHMKEAQRATGAAAIAKQSTKNHSLRKFQEGADHRGPLQNAGYQ